MISIFLVIGGLAVWRISTLFAKESGPFSVFVHIRRYFGSHTSSFHKTIFEGIKCIWCNSVWFGIAITAVWILSPTAAFAVCLPFAMSAVAIGIEKVYSL